MAVQAGVGRVVDGEIVLLSATGIGTVVIMRRTGQSKALATTLHGGGRREVAARQALSSGQDGPRTRTVNYCSRAERKMNIKR